MHKVLVNGLGGLSLPRKSVVRLIDLPVMTSAVDRGSKTTTFSGSFESFLSPHLVVLYKKKLLIMMKL